MASKPAAKKKKPAAKKKAAPKKKPAAALLDLYESLQSNVFEVVFSRDKKLVAAFLTWARKTHPTWNDEVDEDDDPATRAVKLEMLITDEVDEAAFVAFFESLPDAQRKAAITAMKAARSDAEDDGPSAGAAQPAPTISIAGVAYTPGSPTLSLENQQLTEVPAAIGELSALESLDLSSNPLTQLPPELARCTRLTCLILYGCKQLTVPALPALRTVMAQETSAALARSLAASPTIVSLNLMACGLTELPDELRALTRLDYLDISDNKIARLPRWLGELPLKAVHHGGNPLPKAELAWLKTVLG